MPGTSQIKQDLEGNKALLLITESLGEVAAIKFKSIHKQIEQNSAFFDEIAKVYQAVRLVASKQRAKTKKSEDPAVVARGEKTVSVLLTSNFQFYGGLDNQLIKYFIINTSKYETDKIVVGSTGADYFKSVHYPFKYQPMIFHKDLLKPLELQQLVSLITGYKKILIYYSKYVTVLNQQAAFEELRSTEVAVPANIALIDYILEPELDKMLIFFETQILASRLDSLFLQAQLSRITARMVGMDQAELNAENLISREKVELLKQNRNVQSQRMLETYTDVKLMEARDE
jgi:ATP synthase F1 gamma subunit